MELEESSTPFGPVEDKRPMILPPPPVALVSVTDCVLRAAVGLEGELEKFYIGLLGFERDRDAVDLVFRAENFRLRIDLAPRSGPREDFRPLGIVVPSLRALMLRLDELEMVYVYERGLMPGSQALQIFDPARNMLEITDNRGIMF